MRFSIKGLLIIIAAVAVGCAALLKANAAWLAVAYGGALMCLFIAVLGIIYRRGARRAFWSGFAIFGGGYLLLIGANPGGEWASRLPTHSVLEKLHPLVATEREVAVPQPRSGYGGYGSGYGGGYGGGYGESGYDGGYGQSSSPRTTDLMIAVMGSPFTPKQLSPALTDFCKVGHPLCLLLVALAGGFIGRYYQATSERDTGG